MQVGLKANEIDREVDEDYGLQRIRLGLGESYKLENSHGSSMLENILQSRFTPNPGWCQLQFLRPFGRYTLFCVRSC